MSQIKFYKLFRLERVGISWYVTNDEVRADGYHPPRYVGMSLAEAKRTINARLETDREYDARRRRESGY